MERVLKGSVFTLLAAGALALTACGGGDSGASTGALSLHITDAPVDGAEKVVIQFRGLELHGPGGTTTLFYCPDANGQSVISATACPLPAPRELDLKALNSGTSAVLLDAYTLPAGHYSWVRLLVDADPRVAGDSYVVLKNQSNEYELEIPSNEQSGLKLNRGFTVPAGGHASFTIDFDLRKSIHLPSSEGAPYVLRPTLRIVDSVVVGAIAGTVDLTGSTCASPAVYVYAGENATTNDISGAATDPVTTALVNTSTGQYRAAFLEPGTYTVALTCAAAQDDPANDDSTTFTGAANVTVTTGITTIHDF